MGRVNFLVEKPCLFIDLIHGNCILPCCSAEQDVCHPAQEPDLRLHYVITSVSPFFGKGGNALQASLNSGAFPAAVIAVNLDLIAQFKKKICIPAVCAEPNDPSDHFLLGNCKISTSSSL